MLHAADISSMNVTVRVFAAMFTTMLAVFRSRTAFQLEILALRHQLVVLQHSVKRPKLTAVDRRL